MSFSHLKTNLEKIKSQIAGQANLLVVSKNHEVEEIEFLYQLGQRDFGENKVQELLDKSNKLLKSCPEIIWHMIGPLQSNKISLLRRIPRLRYLHSVDRLSILEKLLDHKSDFSELNLFLQVKTSFEKEKSGFDPQEITKELIEKISSPYLFAGLMTMAPIRGEDLEGLAHKSFKSLKEVRDSICPNAMLSMGMSSDFQVALNYDTSWVRVGSLVFKK